ncbi:MAG: hypothetical protein EOM54_08425 [Clostridia bacterium]|nr:hypothetical protein [Clostridia bacterium]
MYFAEKNTNRIAMSWLGLDFKKFKEAEDKINQPCDEEYISAFTFGNESYFVEHNEKLVSNDAAQIFGLVSGALFKMKAL